MIFHGSWRISDIKHPFYLFRIALGEWHRFTYRSLAPTQILLQEVYDLFLERCSRNHRKTITSSDGYTEDLIFAHPQFFANIYKFDRIALPLFSSLQLPFGTIDAPVMDILNYPWSLPLGQGSADLVGYCGTS